MNFTVALASLNAAASAADAVGSAMGFTKALGSAAASAAGRAAGWIPEMPEMPTLSGTAWAAIWSLLKHVIVPAAFVSVHTYVLLWIAVLLISSTADAQALSASPALLVLLGALALADTAHSILLPWPFLSWGGVTLGLLLLHAGVQAFSTCNTVLRSFVSVLLLLLTTTAFCRVEGPELNALTAGATVVTFTAAGAMGAASIIPIFGLLTYAVAAFPAHFALHSLLAGLPAPLLTFGVFRGPLGLVAFIVHLSSSLKASGALGHLCAAALRIASQPVSTLCLCAVKRPTAPILAERLAGLVAEQEALTKRFKEALAEKEN